jgi:hypothetical protein
MTRHELDLLAWLAAEQRPVSHLIAMPSAALNAWVRSHGGKAKHLDALCWLCNNLRFRLSSLATAADNVLQWRQ